MDFMHHTTLDAVGNVLRVHYKSMKRRVSLKLNSITLAGSELVGSWFELKCGLSSSLLAAN